MTWSPSCPDPFHAHMPVAGIVHPEITAMQASAIFEAAANVMQEGVKPKVKIMVPLVRRLWRGNERGLARERKQAVRNSSAAL
jgi:hypothetical protein